MAGCYRMTIDDLKKTIEKIGLAVDGDSGEVLVEWAKIPFSEEDRPYWAALSSILGIGPRTLPVLIAGFGSAEAVFHQSKSSLSSIELSEKVIAAILHYKKERNIPDWFNKIRAAAAGRPESKFITAVDPEFPPLLRQFRGAPCQLWVWGNAQVLSANLPIAVVGTRKMSYYGREATTRLVKGLSGRNCVIVSGLMYGVDETAMRAALGSKGLVVGVWAGGLTRQSLGSRWNLASAIVGSGGAVVSEFPASQLPHKTLFPARNRIVSGLSRAVIVTEGAVKSGSLITARFAMEQGRSVLAVPGPITSQTSAGANELIKLGAHLITDSQDVFDLLGYKGHQSKFSPPELAFEPQNESQAAVYSALREKSMSADEIVRATAMSAGQVGEILVELELLSIAAKIGEDWVLK